MGGLYAVLDKSVSALTDTVLNQVKRLVPDYNKFPPALTVMVNL